MKDFANKNIRVMSKHVLRLPASDDCTGVCMSL